MHNKSTFDQFMRKVNRNASGILSVAPMKGRYVWLNEELEVPSRLVVYCVFELLLIIE